MPVRAALVAAVALAGLAAGQARAVDVEVIYTGNELLALWRACVRIARMC
jgi:hypothetical protein